MMVMVTVPIMRMVATVVKISVVSDGTARHKIAGARETSARAKACAVETSTAIKTACPVETAAKTTGAAREMSSTSMAAPTSVIAGVN